MTRRTRAASLACVLALVVAACGDDDDSEDAAATTAATETTSGGDTTAEAATTTAGGTATTRGATTTAGGAAAADNPAGFGASSIVDGGPYGQDPDNPELYRGAGGFELDLSECPSDYDPVQGITDTEIRLAHTLPKSGPLAGFGLITDGMSSYFNYVNETYGGIDGRQIKLDYKDDAYEPARTQTNVSELLESREYAAFPEILGTANNLAVWDELNEECMPQIVIGSGAAQWGDVENHPWSTGLQIDYFSEAVLWADWIKQENPDGATVAAITFNNDYGKSYQAGFKSAIEGSNIELVAEELHDASVPNLTNQFTSLAASDADYLLIETSGAFCTQALAEVERGSWKPVVIMSATCQSLAQYFQPLINQGLTGDGTHMIQSIKDPGDPAFADDPFIQLFKETVSAQGLDPAQTTYFTGWYFAWYTVEILRLANELEGGLTRPNIIIANRSMEAEFPGKIEGLTGRMEGLEDAYMTEGGRVVKYTVTDPAVLGSYVPIGDVINNEGELGTYATVEASLG